MKTKKLFTSLAAAVMLSTSLAGSGAVLSQTAHAADTTQTASTNAQAQKGTISVKRRSVAVTVNSDKPTLLAVTKDGKTKPVASTYTKGQAIQVYYSVPFTATAQGSEGQHAERARQASPPGQIRGLHQILEEGCCNAHRGQQDD